MGVEDVNRASEKELRAIIEQVADSLCRTVHSDFDFRIEIDSEDQSAQKLGLLVNFVLGNFRRAISEIRAQNILLDERIRLRTRELEAARKRAEVASQAKSTFVAHVSHELRTPIAGILGFIDLARDVLDKKHITGEDIEAALHDLESAEKAGFHLLDLVNSVLDLSKIEAGRIGIRLAPVDLKAVAEDALESIAPLVAKNGNQTELIYSKGLRPVMSDEAKLRQCLINLLANAAKFTQNGKISVVIEQESDMHLIEVRDTGNGMGPAELKRIFNAFEQANDNVSMTHGGTGLGLTITARIMEMLGGKITVASELGYGASFVLHMPVTASPFAEEPVKKTKHKDVPQVPAQELAKMKFACRALILDDQDANRNILSRQLGRMGVEVFEAADGAQGLKFLQEAGKPVDLIITDCSMPVMDGYEFSRQVRAWEESESRDGLPIIALTAHAFSGEREKCEDAGMDDFLAKPVPFNALAELLNKWAPGSTTTETSAEPKQKAPKKEAAAKTGIWRHVDKERLLEIMGELDNETLKILAEGFIDNWRDLIVKLGEIIQNGKPDLKELAENAHALKGLARSFAVEKLANSAYELERAAKDGDVLLAVSGANELILGADAVLADVANVPDDEMEVT